MDEKKELKIAMLGHKRIPSREGGIEIVVEQLAVRMAQAGNDVTCYNRKGHHVSGSEFDKSTKKEYKSVHIKSVFTIDKKGLAALSSSFFASIKTAFSHYDIVHFHAEGPCAMIWLPHLFGKKTVATIHGLDWARSKWGGFATKYIKHGEKNAVKYADEIIVLSEGVKQYFKDTYNRETVLIPNGVETAQVLPPELITEKISLKKDGYYLYLGRLVPEKGIEYLINAYKSTDCKRKLVIAGGSSDTNEYAEHLKILASDDERIKFTGFVDGQILKELYSNAYTYILPSDLEGMPLSLLEAMSYGNCCLTSDIPECADVIEDCGITFKKGDEKDLAEKIIQLEENEKVVDDFKLRAADFITEKYNWDDITEKTLNLYNEAINRNNKSK